MTLSVLRRSSIWVSVYAVAVLVGRLTALPETGLALFWPAAGVAALWVLTSHAGAVRLDVGLLFASTVLLNASSGVALVPALVFGVANVVVGVCARAVLVRSVDHEDGSSAELPRATLGSTRGVIALGALAWAVRNATGVFVVAGLVLAVDTARRTRSPGPSSAWSTTAWASRRT